MMPIQWHLAQVNIGRARGAITDPVMQGFVTRLEEINALAERSPGFVWRLQTEDGNATAFRPYPDDDGILINLSVWSDVDSLREYVFRSLHAEVMRQRREWFERFEGVYAALWWVPAGHRPSLEEAVERIAHLEAHGPTAHAFTFAKAFDHEGRQVTRERSPDDEACPAV
jgi:hypothetical protein